MHRFIVSAMLLATSVTVPMQTQAQTAQTASQVQAAPSFAQRAKELVGILQGTGDYTTYFTKAFQTAVPKDRFAPVTAQLLAAYGAPVELSGTTLRTPFSGTVRVRFAKSTLAFQLTVDPAEPHQVSGLLSLGPIAAERTLDEVTRALAGLHGVTAYAFAKLGGASPQLIVAHNADSSLAVGSAFKLVILAELVRATNAGERTWNDSVTIDGRVLPGGGYTTRPAGSRVTVRELATQMISISDNSATDLLLAALGRNKVEAMLPVLGVRADPRNVPFLSTLEAFKLKWLQNGGLATRFNALDDAGQRALLTGEIATVDITPLRMMGAPPSTPSHIESVEWFYSPNDLTRIMDWLRRNTEGPAGAEARAILSRNAGIPIDRTQYSWVGFKGGSEPGVMNLTLLLRGTDSAWYVATATWNDSARPVEEMRFVELVSALAQFAVPRR